MDDKRIWFDARGIENDTKVMSLVLNLNYSHILINSAALSSFSVPHKVQLIIYCDMEETDMENFPKKSIIMSGSRKILEYAKEKGFQTAFHGYIDSWETLNDFIDKGSKENIAIAELKDETNIPIELILAKRKNDYVIMKLVNTCTEAEVAIGVMESGTDGIMLNTTDLDEIIKVNNIISTKNTGKLDILQFEVLNVEHIGLGYRACIDTTEILQPDEGMIIGSTSYGGLLVSSETHYLPYMELRPFRVNAGAIHSYVWVGNEKTAYLTELKAGTKIMCVDTKGNYKIVPIGRVKIEKRPLILLNMRHNEYVINTIVQDDWHVRVFNGDGKPVNITEIRKGDKLLGYGCLGGRHVGIKIEESIIEN